MRYKVIAGLLCFVSVCFSFFTENTYASSYPQIERQIDTAFDGIEKKIEKKDIDEQINIYQNIIDKIILIQLTKTNLDSKSKFILEYIDEKCQSAIKELQTDTVKLDEIFEDIIQEEKEEPIEDFLNGKIKVISTSKDISIDKKSLENAQDLSLGTFTVKGYRKNAHFYIWIPKQYTGSYKGKISLFRNGVQVASAYPNENGLVLFNKVVDLKDGEYEFVGEYTNIKEGTKLSSYFHFGTGTIQLHGYKISKSEKEETEILAKAYNVQDIITDGTKKLTIGQFKVSGKEQDTGIGIYLKSNKYAYSDTYHGFSGYLTLKKDGRTIKTQYVEEQTTPVIQGVDLSDGVYTLEGNIYGISSQHQIQVYLQYSTKKPSLALNAFSNKEEIVTTQTSLPSIVPGYMEHSERKDDTHIGKFILQKESIDIELMELEFYFDENIDFDLEKGKIFLYDNYGRLVGSNYGYRNSSSNSFSVTIRNLILKPGTYHFYAHNLEVSDDAYLRVVIDEIQVDDYESELFEEKKISTAKILAPKEEKYFFGSNKDIKVIAVGAYEGVYKSGEGHGWTQGENGNFVHHRDTGEIHVGIDNDTKEDIVLVLSTYEPVNWKIYGDVDTLKGIIVSGYHNSSIEGIVDGTPIINTSYKNNKTSDYFYSYKDSDTNYRKMSGIVKELTGKQIDEFAGAYAVEEFDIEFYDEDEIIIEVETGR